MTAHQTIRWLVKPFVFIAALVPASLLAHQLVTGNLGADPLAEITNGTGLWALRFLAVTLALTPLRRLSGWNDVIRFRRMIGLFAFFYGSLHLGVFVVAGSIGTEIYKRPYITVGFTSWLIMFALALTSTAGMIRRLGGGRWQALHRLVYVAAIAGVVHYWWSVKADVRDPRAYAVVVTALMAFRVALWTRTHATSHLQAFGRRAVTAGSRDVC